MIPTCKPLIYFSLTFLLLLGGSIPQAFSFPLIDNGPVYFDYLNARSEENLPYLLPDHKDPHLYYYLFDRIKVLENEDGLPDFSLSYSQKGAVISFSVEPSLDEMALLQVKNKILGQDREARFAPVPLNQGLYHLTLKTTEGEKSIEVNSGTSPDLFGNPWSVQLILNKDMADTIVAALHTGAIFGVNYSFKFTAAILPSLVRVRLNKSKILRTLEVSPFQTEASLASIVRKMQKDKTITIETVGENNALDLAMVILSRWIQDRCLSGLEGNLGQVAFRSDLPKCQENLPTEFTIQSPGTLEATATAGGSLWSYCLKYPSLYNFRGKDNKIIKGCPDRLLPDVGETVNGPWAAPLKELPAPQLPFPTPVMERRE